MKYISIDIETTGIDPDTCELIELAAVLDDMKTPLDECPTFRYRVRESTYKGEPYALSMHAEFFEDMAELPEYRVRKQVISQSHYDSIGPRHQLLLSLTCWLRTHKVDPKDFNVAGKNFANFDARFIRRLPSFETIKWHHIILDPGSMWARRTDASVPNTKTCVDRAGIDISDLPGKTHTALHDALVVCLLLRKGLNGE